MIRKQTTLLIVIVSALLMGLSITINAQSFVQPGIPFTQEDLDELKNNINKEPWKTGFTNLANDSRSSINYGMQGPREIVGRAPDVNRNPWINDMIAIHNQAWMWVFTDDPTYAENGINILNRWATTHKQWSGGEAHLDLGDHVSYFVTGADILRSYKEGWTEEVDRNVRKYFEEVFWPSAAVPYPLRPCNQGAFQIKYAIAIAAFLQDQEKWDQTIESYRIDGGGGLANSLPNGQIGDAGRDEGHWYGQYEALTWATEVMWKQGVDLYSEENNRMLTISELYTRFMVDDTKDTWIPFGGNYDWGYFGGFGASAGARRESSAYSIIENAYKTRLGIETPYTSQFKEIIGSSNNFLYVKETDNSQAQSLEPLTFPKAMTTLALSSMDIGKPSLAGSAENTNGEWTLKGTGEIKQSAQTDDFYYTFQPVEGDLQVIARITSLSSKGKAGVMIRNSLDENANYVAFMVDADGASKLTGRGIEGWNSTRIGHGGAGAPHWFKLERRGPRVGAYHSHDGKHWTCAGMVYFQNAPDEFFGGICVTSTNNNMSSTEEAVFTDVAISAMAPESSPVITSVLNVRAAASQEFSYVIKALANPTDFDVSGLPEGLVLDRKSGMITGVVNELGRSLVTISASNGKGTGKALLILDVISGTNPDSPSGLTLENSNINEVTLSWNAVENATAYSVKRALTQEGEYEVLMSDISQPIYIDKNANPGYNYYVVIAHTNGHSSVPTEQAMILLPPDIPQDVTVSSTKTQISLQWDEATGAETYKVKRSETSGGLYTEIATVNDPSYIDKNVNEGDYYYYVITSVAGEKESMPSKELLGVPGMASYTWNPEATSSLWSKPANWQGGTIPASPAILHFGASEQETLENDLEDMIVAQIIFEEGAPSYTIEGNQVKIKSEIRNNSGVEQILKLPVELTGQVETNVSKGTIRLNSVLSGTGGLVKRGFGYLYVTGENTYSGGTTIYDTGGDWGSRTPVVIVGNAEFTEGKHIQGPLGIGNIIMAGGALQNEGTANLYNDIYFEENTTSYSFTRWGGLHIYGGFKGKGAYANDGGDSYDALNLYGDNSEFEGTFSSISRTSFSRIRFHSYKTGSAKAYWHLNSGFSDNHRFSDTSAPYCLGGLSGDGLLNTYGNVELEFGHLNTDTEFGGSSTNTSARFTKVGTGTIVFSGILSHSGTTTVKGGKIIVTGTLANSPVVVESGATFGGTGEGDAAITINNGGTLAPGKDSRGTYTTKGKVTLNENAFFQVELGIDQSDKVIAREISINNATLAVTGNGGQEILIMDNTGSKPVDGTFKDLDELGEITIGSKKYCITYKGGDGNDIVLIDADYIRKEVPTAVANLKGTALSSSQIKLSWDASAASEFVTNYIVRRSKSEDGTFEEIALGLKETEYIDKDLVAETIYYYKVYAQNSFGVGMMASLGVKSNKITKPYIPQNIVAYAGSTNVYLRWNQAFEASSYTIKRSETAGGPYTEIAIEVTDTIYNDTGLDTGKAYYYVLESVNSVDKSGNSNEITANTQEGAHAYFPMEDRSGTQVADLWGGFNGSISSFEYTEGIKDKAVYLNGQDDSFIHLPEGTFNGIDDFTIATWAKQDEYRKWGRIWDFGRGTNQYMFLSANRGSNGSTLRFAIKNNTEQGVNSDGFVMPMNTWVHIAVTKQGNTVVIYVNGEEIARNENVTHTVGGLGNLTQNWIGKSQWHPGDQMFKGAIDEFRIYSKALNPNEIAQLTKVESMDAPQNLRGENMGIGIKLDWNVIPNATYNLKRSQTAGGPYTTIVSNKKINTHTDLSAKDGLYYYVVTAVVNNLESKSSEEVFVPTYGLPTTLQKVKAEVLNSSSIRISWEASAANEHVNGYTLLRSEAVDGTYIPIAEDLKVTDFIDSELNSESSYYYRVYTTNFFGDSEMTDVEAKTNALSKPHMPSNLRADEGSTAITIRWDVAYEATAYDVKRTTIAPRTRSVDPYVLVAENLTQTVFTDTNVEEGQTYYYVVLSKNSMGVSEVSAEITAQLNPSAFSYWPMDEESGTQVKDIWGSHNGNSNTATWTKAIVNGGLYMDGTDNSYMLLPNDVVDGLADFTFAIWVNPTEYRKWARVIDFGRGTNNYMFLSSNLGSDNTAIRFAIKNGGTEQQINCNHKLTKNTWTHLTISKSGSVGILYVNGVEVGRNEEMTLNISDLGTLSQNYVGRSQWFSNGDQNFKGKMDDLRIYNKALSEEEIQKIMKMAALSAPANLTGVKDNNQVLLNWVSVLGAESYMVKRSDKTGGAYEVVAKNITENSFVDNAPLQGTSYYVVSAIGNNMESGNSNEVQISSSNGGYDPSNPVPAAPSNLKAAFIDGKVELIWDSVADANTYKVKRADVSGGPYTFLAQTSSNTYVDEEVESNQTYYYIVTALNNSNESVPSNEARASQHTTSNENLLDKDLRIYPNPVKDFLNIEFGRDNTMPKELRLVDLNGSLRLIHKLQSEDYYQFDMSSLKSGMYILIIQQKGKIQSEKVIKVD